MTPEESKALNTTLRRLELLSVRMDSLKRQWAEVEMLKVTVPEKLRLIEDEIDGELRNTLKICERPGFIDELPPSEKVAVQRLRQQANNRVMPR